MAPHSPQRNTLYRAACAYHELGWAIIPVRMNKHAACQWKIYQERQPTPDELQRLFTVRGVRGLAVILGQASGGLYGRDFDHLDAYERWATAYPDFAGTLPTVQTHRGRHVYARWTAPITTRPFADGELRGHGTYLVLPPSKHPRGGQYTWQRPPDATKGIAVLPPDAVGLDQVWAPQEPERETTSLAVVEKPQTPLLALGDLTDTEMVALAMPGARGGNNRQLFFLARLVKTVEEREGRTWGIEKMLQLFEAWYGRNPYLNPTTTKAQYRREFLRAYQSAKTTLDDGILRTTWQDATSQPLPVVALRFVEEDERLLTAWCCELQRVNGDRPFFLSTESVRIVFRMENRYQSSALLAFLVEEGILLMVEKGRPGKATSYRYLPPIEPVLALTAGGHEVGNTVSGVATKEDQQCVN